MPAMTAERLTYPYPNDAEREDRLVRAYERAVDDARERLNAAPDERLHAAVVTRGRRRRIALVLRRWTLEECLLNARITEAP
jgi:hypothetical protein